MFKLKHILVPVDFSTRSRAAALHASLLAKQFGAKLTLAHVLNRFQDEVAQVQTVVGKGAEVISPREMDSRSRGKLQELAGAITGLQVRQEVLTGDPAQEIERFVKNNDVDLIVISTHGFGSFRKFLLGSVTAKILHDVSCPVLTGTHIEEVPKETLAPYQTIGCAVDLEDQSDRQLRWADEFARAWGAKLIAIYAAPFVDVIVDSVHIVTADWRDMVVRAAEEKITNLLKETGIKAELCVATGHPVSFVATAAAEHRLDALVIGRGMAARRSSRLPTHAYGMIRESPCPVISLGPGYGK